MNQFLLIFTFLIMLSGSCNKARSQNSDNGFVSVDPSLEKTIANSTFNEKGIINPTGCQIPMPEQRKKTKESKTFGTTSSGTKVNVNISFYAPIGEFFFIRETDSSPQSQAVTGLLRLELIGEIKSNGKVYGYSIFARKAPKNESNNRGSEEHNHMFVYRCYDSDGDGKFETVVNDGSSFPVPDWVSK